MRRGLLALAVGGLGIAVGLRTLAIVADEPAYSFSGASPLGRAALLAGGWALAAAGIGSWLRSPAGRFGPLLVAAGIGWFLLEWNNPAAGSALAFTAGLALYAVCPPLVGHAALAWRGDPLSRVERAAVALAYAAGLLVLGLLPALFLDPKAEGCSACPRNLLLIASRPSLVDALDRVGLWLGVVSAIGLAALVLPRRSWLPVPAAAAGYLALVAAMDAAWIGHGLLWNGDLGRRLWLGQALALVALALGVAWSWARARRSRAAVARITLELAHSPPPGGLRDALAGIVGDESLELAYPLEGSGRLIDAQGHDVALGAGKERTRLVAGGRDLAVLAHAPGLLADEQLRSAVTAAVRLALDNERLQAEVRAQLGELRRSRARIVEAGDAERTRLERDLHDGAQQRLAGLVLSLRLVRAQLVADADPAVAEELVAAEAELRVAIDGLRNLAHGLFPAVLVDGGLSAAFVALAEEAPIPIRVGGVSPVRYAPEVESAAYAVVAETAAAARGGLVVNAARSDGALVLEVEARGLAAQVDLVELEDRVEAADGHLAVERSNGATTIRAEFPCAS